MKKTVAKVEQYGSLLNELGSLLAEARGTAVRAVNSLMTATYWEIGRRIVEFEQGGEQRAGYGEELIARLSEDLTERFGKGFSEKNLENMRRFYQAFIPEKISQTLSAKSKELICPTPSGKLTLSDLARAFPLPWSHYVLLVSRAKSPEALEFYHAEALRGGWSVRQLDRQISSLFYERAALSKNKAAMLKKGEKALPSEKVTPEEALRDPLVLEFLNLRDEYSESELEDALVRHLEAFLLELGSDFSFVGRQRRLRIGDEWYRVDLLFFHRRLRCLVVIDLKLGKFTHADAGQMHMYLNYATEHWTNEDENPPIGLILCTHTNDALAKYSLENLPNKVAAREYKLILPDEKRLAAELQKVRLEFESKKPIK
ncbi:MAG: PDDEXK nuclease domain-containing protein [Verrucomicrobiales bacterium]|jgi:predicted nuclease of restriction endonuclease-like (RecB) superfamily|nr:PDDEXK nuclease domain-containing protein [Verrucomicrobiales bacterium]